MTTPTATGAPSPLATANLVRGRFIWHELVCHDQAAALRFYPDVASWTTTSMTAAPGTPPYSMFVNGSTPIAGVTTMPVPGRTKGEPANWLPYMGTPDVDATWSEATALGAKEMLAPTDIPTVGRIAVLTDPRGACFALFAPSRDAGAESAPAHGEFSWHELVATDPDAAFDFYARLFGWEKMESMDMGAAGMYEMFGQGGFMYGGVYRCTPTEPVPHWRSYIQVADLERATRAVLQRGGKVVMGPHEVPGGDRIVVCTDDQGTDFALHGKKVA